MAYTTDQYDDLSIDKFLCIDIRRDCVGHDAFRVYHKRKFDPAKLVKVSNYSYIVCSAVILVLESTLIIEGLNIGNNQ